MKETVLAEPPTSQILQFLVNKVYSPDLQWWMVMPVSCANLNRRESSNFDFISMSLFKHSKLHLFLKYCHPFDENTIWQILLWGLRVQKCLHTVGWYLIICGSPSLLGWWVGWFVADHLWVTPFFSLFCHRSRRVNNGQTKNNIMITVTRWLILGRIAGYEKTTI